MVPAEKTVLNFTEKSWVGTHALHTRDETIFRRKIVLATFWKSKNSRNSFCYVVQKNQHFTLPRTEKWVEFKQTMLSQCLSHYQKELSLLQCRAKRNRFLTCSIHFEPSKRDDTAFLLIGVYIKLHIFCFAQRIECSKSLWCLILAEEYITNLQPLSQSYHKQATKLRIRI